MSENAEAVAVATPAAPPAAPVAPAEGGTPAQNTADSAAATPQGDEKTPKTPDPADKRGTSRFERRISRLHREAAEARAERDFLKRQMEESRAKEAADPAAPKLESFKDIEEYATAKAKYEAEKTLKQHQATQRAEAARREQAKLVETWETRAVRGSEKYDDFDEVVGEIKPTTPWALAIMEAENGDEIAYHLGKNLGEARRIASLPPTAQIREIGKLEYRLAAEPQKPKTPSKAPAPITPVSGAAPVEAKSVYDKDITYDQFVKLRNKQLGRTK